MLTYGQNSHFFYMQTLLQKMHINQAQSNWFVFQEVSIHKREGRADLS